MLELNNILTMWEQDCKINNMKLDDVSRETPNLHAKYLRLLSESKLQFKRAEFKQKILLKDKWLYYNGKMSQHELEEKEWDPDPFNGLKVLKGEMEHYYNSDPEIQKSEELIEYWKTTRDTLIDIVDNIKWRHQTIGNMIKWRQFEAGS
jgi:c-di-GMP-related signal transduction protein|tara:strand:- start:350 stop:796 length:447 start_codon:yes stop_codon:yes gene_type:complete